MSAIPLLAVALSPALALSTLVCIVGGAGAQPETSVGVCGPGGTGQTISGVTLDAEQMANATTIVSVAAGRGLPPYAAVIAEDVAYTESVLRNTTTHTDHDSEGLFQQRISVYTKQVADNPVQATGAFLDRLVHVPRWQTNPVGVDAQAVQISGRPDRYQPNAALAEQLVGRLWPSAAARPAPTADPAEPRTSAPSSTEAAVCPGGDGAVPLVGWHGNNVAGTTTIPVGLAFTGTAKGNAAARFALQQLGKPYVFDAAGPDTYDCSGLTLAAWATQGIALVHLAATQATEGTPEPPDLSQAVSGDLVLIPGADGTPQAPGHVGMVVGETIATTPDGKRGRDLWLVQAPGYADLPVELTEATQWAGQISAVRHIA